MTEKNVDLVAQFLEELERIDVFTGLPKTVKPPPDPAGALERAREARRLIAEDRWAQRQAELSQVAKQRAIDSAWEATLDAKRAEAERADDPEAAFEEMIWGPELRRQRAAERRLRADELAARAVAADAIADAMWRRGRKS